MRSELTAFPVPYFPGPTSNQRVKQPTISSPPAADSMLYSLVELGKLPLLALEKLALFFLRKMYKPSLVLVNNKSPLADENKQEETFLLL